MSSSKADSESNSYINKTWELNIYELNRMPHEIIRDSTEIAVSPKILQNELMCPICLDILKNTMTTKECLHRFCHDCIITALRAGNKECPTCRKKLVSKRSLRPDPNFDGIISKIYPNREEYDALHEKVLEKLNKKHLTAINNLNSSSQANKTPRQNSRTNKAATTTGEPATNGENNENASNNEHSSNKKGGKANHAASSSSAGGAAGANGSRGTKRAVSAINHSYDSDMESRASTEHSSLHMTTDPDEIELILKPHPFKETALSSSRFLKTTCNATMNHLSKYLWTRLCVEENKSLNQDSNASNDFTIFIFNHESKQSAENANSASYQPLSATLTLENVLDRYWKSNKPIELFYLFKATKSVDSESNEATASGGKSDQQPTTSLSAAN